MFAAALVLRWALSSITCVMLQEVVDEPEALVFVLIDEVESLTAARCDSCCLHSLGKTLLAELHVTLAAKKMLPACADFSHCLGACLPISAGRRQ